MYKVMPLFATPVLIDNYKCPDDIYQYFDTIELFDQSSIDYGNKSKNTFILNEEICKPLASHILNVARSFLDEQLGHKFQDVQFTQSWVSHKNVGEYHQKHSHANSIISGVYYFQEGIESFPPIRFYKHNINCGVYEILLPLQSDVSQKPFSWAHYTYTPMAGDIVMFPSYLQHSVEVNTTGSTRKSLAFNIIPTVEFGNLKGLTLLKFSDVK